jgi:long-subunit fatty acid transport protein
MDRAICVALLCGLAATASAQPRMDPTVGRAVFTGATMPAATSIEQNPAALALGTADEYYAAVTGVVDQLSIHTRTQDSSGALSSGPAVSTAVFGPGAMLAAVWHLKDRASIGLTIGTHPVEMAPTDELALQYHTLGLRERRYYSGAVAASVRITDELYFGLSLSAEQRRLHLRYAVDAALAAGHGAGGVDSDCGGSPCGIGNPLATQIYDVNVKSDLLSLDALTPNVGIVYQLGQDLYVGLSYHAPPGLAIQNTLTGDLTLTQQPRLGGGQIRGGASVNIQEPASADAEVRARVIPGYDLHVGLRWEDLSRFQAYDVRTYGTGVADHGAAEWTERPRGFHDPVALWAGLEQIEAKELWQWRFGGRLGLQTSAVPDQRTSPMAIAPLSFTADLGAEVRIPGTPMILQLTYGLQYFPTVHVTNSVYAPDDSLACMDSGYDYSTPACESVRRGYAIETAAGDYSKVEHAIRIGLRYVKF